MREFPLKIIQIVCSIYFARNHSIPAHTTNIISVEIIEYPTAHSTEELKCPIQSTVSLQSHFRIASELA